MTKSYVLPHTELTVPVALCLSGFGHMETHDGIAWRVDVHADGTHIGNIEDDGHGGGAWFYPASRQGREAFGALREKARDHTGKPLDEEALCHLLGDEAELAMEVRKADKARGKVAIRLINTEGERTVGHLTHKPWAGTYPRPSQLRSLELDKDTVRADVWHGPLGWVQFHPAAAI